MSRDGCELTVAHTHCRGTETATEDDSLVTLRYREFERSVEGIGHHRLYWDVATDEQDIPVRDTDVDSPCIGGRGEFGVSRDGLGGDVVGEYLLKHNANHEARTVVRNLFGEVLEPVDYSAMPFAVFASPEVAGVGAREQDLAADGREYATNTYRYEKTARGDAMKAEGFVKVLIDVDGAILGCHIIGPDASILVQEVVVAMKAGSGTVRDIRESVHIHPALPEVVQRAFSGQFSRGGSNLHRHH